MNSAKYHFAESVKETRTTRTFAMSSTATSAPLTGGGDWTLDILVKFGKQGIEGLLKLISLKWVAF